MALMGSRVYFLFILCCIYGISSNASWLDILSGNYTTLNQKISSLERTDNATCTSQFPNAKTKESSDFSKYWNCRAGMMIARRIPVPRQNYEIEYNKMIDNSLASYVAESGLNLATRTPPISPQMLSQPFNYNQPISQIPPREQSILMLKGSESATQVGKSPTDKEFADQICKNRNISSGDIGSLESYNFQKCLNDTLENKDLFSSDALDAAFINEILPINKKLDAFFTDIKPYKLEISNSDTESCSAKYSVQKELPGYDKCLKSAISYKKCHNSFATTLLEASYNARRECIISAKSAHASALAQSKIESVTFSDGRIANVTRAPEITVMDLSRRRAKTYEICLTAKNKGLRELEFQLRGECNKILINN